MASTTTPTSAIAPPIPRREEGRVVYAGVAPEGWKADLPRQSEASTEKLMDPAVGVPDPYGWMRDEKREDPEIMDHLKAENAYTEAQTGHLAGLRTTLYNEMLSAIQETDYTTPRPHGDFWYYTRTFAGKSYTVHCRAPKTLDHLSVEWDGTAEAPIVPGEQGTYSSFSTTHSSSLSRTQSSHYFYCSTLTLSYPGCERAGARTKVLRHWIRSEIA